MVSIDPSITDKVPYAITDAERIPAQRYYDERFYNLELERFWPHVWQMACRLEQIPEPGDWIEYTNVGYSIIVVRTNDGVKAFHNACRHRGVPFAGGTTVDSSHPRAHGNCAKTGFVCPFHGWRWNMDGENTFVYGRHLFSERQLDPDDINLRPCRVETAIGCVFVNLDDNAPSYRETVGPLIGRMEAHAADSMRAEWCFGTVLPANWKLAMEAFMEGLHVMQTHPQLYAESGEMFSQMYEKQGTPNYYNPVPEPGLSAQEAIAKQITNMQVLSDGMAGMIHQKEVDIAREVELAGLPDDPEQAFPMWLGRLAQDITDKLGSRGEPVPDLVSVTQSDPVAPVEFIFPNFFLLANLGSMSSYRIRPLGPEHCFFEIWSLTTFPEGEEQDPVMETTVLPFNSPDFPEIPRQDYSNIPLQQKGLHAKGFEFMRLSKAVEGLVSNFHRTLDGYLAELPLDQLLSGTRQLGGNFDGPILDLGF